MIVVFVASSGGFDSDVGSCASGLFSWEVVVELAVAVDCFAGWLYGAARVGVWVVGHLGPPYGECMVVRF